MEQLKHLLSLVTALGMLMSANVLLGVIIADLKTTFDKEKLKKGVKKAVAFALALVMVYIAGLCVPYFEVEYDGKMLTIIDALDTIFLGGIGLYVGKVMKNFYKFLTLKDSAESSPFDSIPAETALEE